MRAALCRRCLCKQLHAHGRGCSASFARCGMCANACRLLGSPASVCGSAQLSSGCPCGFSLPPRFFGVFFFFPFELWSGCSSFFLPDLSFWQLASSRSGVCSVFLLRPRPTVAGGVRVRRGCVSGAEPTSVRGSVYLGPFGTRLHPRHTGFSGPARRVPGGEHRCSGGGVGKSQSCWGVVSGQFWAGFGSVRWIASW